MTEYLAKRHPEADKVFDLMKQWTGNNGNSIRRKLNAMIKEHPDLIAAYYFRREILEYEDNLTAEGKERKRAYEAVMTYCFPEGLPDSLPWGHLENRPLLLALTFYAETLWLNWKGEEADILFRKILTMNPTDNQGARFSYLAFLEDNSYNQLQQMIENGSHLDWFKKNSRKHIQLKTYWEP